MPKHVEKEPKSNSAKKIVWWVVTILVIIGIGAFAISRSRSTNKNDATRSSQQSSTKKAKPKKKPQPKVKLTKAEKKIARRYKLTSFEVANAKKRQVTAIGDSVMVDIEWAIKEVMPHSTVNGEVGRQFNQLPGIVAQLKANGSLANNIVINLGTNGPPTQTDVNSVLKEVGTKRQIFWINTHVPTQPWEKTTNKLIAKTAKKHSNVHVVNWYKLSKHHKAWFAADDVHVGDVGAKYYVAEIAKVMADVYNK